MHDVSESMSSLVRLVKRHRDPVVVQALRSTVAATIAYVIAKWLTRSRRR